MAVDVKVPSVGESVKEGMIHKWHVKSGDYVNRDQVLVELETDKATVEVVAEAAGVIQVGKKQGDMVAVGEVIASIDTAAAKPAGGAASAPASAPAASPAPAPAAKPVAVAPAAHAPADSFSPAVRRIVAETGVDTSKVAGSGRDGRLTKGDVLGAASGAPAAAPAARAPTPAAPSVPAGSRGERREPMSMLRRRIAERLVQAQSTAAILTTFNEIDMTAVMALRAQYKDSFKEKYGISLGFMSFFVKGVIEGLRAFPAINGWIEGNDIVYHDYFDIGVAVSSDRGLVVPVVRNADRLSFAEMEMAIGNFAKRARDGKITVDELTGGTFTVSNGGVFGSLMSTPILNPPQSGILGMHKIQERPVVVNGQVVVRPMMYVALSYDHRIVDGREAVQFLVKVKECVEDPTRILIGV
ncbi:MAG: 2-oxoglutarate dehydrogenase complex dihydrolipoyllysine-residue succinyltransferase [Pseudomonadota bacterium]|jgi:2-oxoglutarate dehydrogenase E2 component (dihydrolipoamide succinyltransferase)